MASEYTTVSIPKTLYNRIKELIKNTGFTSVSGFVVYVLREVIASYEKEKASVFSEKEREAVIERLKKLGYI